eukprot:TRINITY_DN17004_c0_g1_i1.p1 TRINITY_DN17004_c0_g1~~TRINITY_DN17004_c0_g1_i1.p1  ORF type:complete len:360 (-),score=20.05 TRINITY_DN17004_c0_g1_i1:466-1545(-)
MAISLSSSHLSLHLFLLLFLSPQAKSLSNNTSPFLSPLTFPPNYQKMLQNFKIFAYEPHTEFKITNSADSAEFLFHSSLLKSPFLTTDPEKAHLFYVSLPATFDSRSISRLIKDLRSRFPFWNRTLGADHFYLSSRGLGVESDRNIVELKKNSIQISRFPSTEGRFIPHKDINLPHLLKPQILTPSSTEISKFRAFFNGDGENNHEISAFVNELRGDPEYMIGSEPSDLVRYAEGLSNSRFCLFFYGFGRDLKVGEALRFGCVPVVISGRPILDLPFMDVLRWSEIAVFVGMGGGVKELKSVLDRTCGDQYARMRELGMIASVHFAWNFDPQPHDSFHTVLYQLWLRRHTVRYAGREWS